jgi:hypothetical protein
VKLARLASPGTELPLRWRRLPTMTITNRRPALIGAALVLGTVAACAGSAGAPSPAPSPTIRPTPTPVVAAPTPTPVTVVVGSPFDAATLVIATNPLFTGAAPREEGMIGMSKWWVATPLSDGRFRIDVTIGWGDCMAGCIDRHVWTYEVWPDGRLELISEAGPEVPPDVR